MRAFGLLLVLFSCGCTRTQNVKQGETDYPRLNPHPINVVHLSGTVDAPIGVKSVANWSASNKDCAYSPDFFEGASFMFLVQQPLTPMVSHSHYDLDIPVDEFLPGRCGWHFSAMTIEGSNAVMSGPAPPDAASGGGLDLYCRLSGGNYRCFAHPGARRSVWVHAGVTEIAINLHLVR